MASPGSRSIVPFVLVGLVVALLIGMGVSNFAADTPDPLVRSIIDSACRDAVDEAAVERCVAEQEGEPLLGIQPAALAGYEVTWLSGLVGIIATFVLGTGIVFFLRRTGGSSANPSSRAR